jgi:hypothetical protein
MRFAALLTLPRTRLVSLACTFGAAFAAEVSPPTPDRTLNDDLGGPRVEWVARVVQAYPLPDGTCLLVERTREQGACAVPPGPSAMVCDSGSLDGPGFAPGREIRVAGNLGPRMRRSYGNTVVDSAVVAAPHLAPLEDSAQGLCQAAYGPAPYPAPAVGGGIWWHRRHW